MAVEQRIKARHGAMLREGQRLQEPRGERFVQSDESRSDESNGLVVWFGLFCKVSKKGDGSFAGSLRFLTWSGVFFCMAQCSVSGSRGGKASESQQTR